MLLHHQLRAGSTPCDCRRILGAEYLEEVFLYLRYLLFLFEIFLYVVDFEVGFKAVPFFVGLVLQGGVNNLFKLQFLLQVFEVEVECRKEKGVKGVLNGGV
jgi:hypothetical protein